jgi:hypothetical protein
VPDSCERGYHRGVRIVCCLAAWLLLGAALPGGRALGDDEPGPRKHIAVRGIYGGVPTTLMGPDRTLRDSGANAVWIGEGGITPDGVAALEAQGARVFAEFNTLHRAEYLEQHPDAAPVGSDGQRAPAPYGWQGICPTHTAYRAWRMQAFRELLAKHDIDGVWLDYHHAHASWERAEPALPDTCFCARCLAKFRADTKTSGADSPDAVAAFLAKKEGAERQAWIAWRCSVFTDWVREFREIRDATRPSALLGTFHCPWTDEERDGALKAKLAIDLRAQKKHIDVFSPMPYHARFGHADDPAWISRQTAWLGRHLELLGRAEEGTKIWPIVQISDWGEAVAAEQIPAVLDHGTRAPATGVMVFRWGALRDEPAKVDAMARFYRAIGR